MPRDSLLHAHNESPTPPATTPVPTQAGGSDVPSDSRYGLDQGLFNESLGPNPRSAGGDELGTKGGGDQKAPLATALLELCIERWPLPLPCSSTWRRGVAWRGAACKGPLSRAGLPNRGTSQAHYCCDTFCPPPPPPPPPPHPNLVCADSQLP